MTVTVTAVEATNIQKGKGMHPNESATAQTTTGAAAGKPDLGQFGVWTVNPVSPDVAVELESLGYGAVWASSSAPDDLSWVDPIFDRTTTLKAATGIINIWTSPAGPVAEAFHRLEHRHPGRFVLGIGAGHREVITQWEKPFDALNAYLDDLDRYGVPAHRRVLAALGDGILKLSARRGAGAHPYLTTPEHTARARNVMGPAAFLAPEQKLCCPTTSQRPAHWAARHSTCLSVWPTIAIVGNESASPTTMSPNPAVTNWSMPSSPTAPPIG